MNDYSIQCQTKHIIMFERDQFIYNALFNIEIYDTFRTLVLKETKILLDVLEYAPRRRGHPYHRSALPPTLCEDILYR